MESRWTQNEVHMKIWSRNVDEPEMNFDEQLDEF